MTLMGQSLGHYHILEQLGEGGMATVYKAYDTHLERDVAVKVIRLDQFSPASLREVLTRFEREAKSLARLTHPNIVNISDYGEQDNTPYLVMEYLPGGTLKDRLGKPMRWQDVCKLLLPIAQALDFAHEQNLIHRDVKPSNILLTKKGQPMLTDFGIAKILDAGGQTLTATGVGIGTPEYMAPEQWMGKTTHQSDIYSLGVVMYEMITGRPPFSADTPAAILLKQINDPLPRPTQFVPDLPEVVEKVLIKAMAKEPGTRYQTMDEFASALEELLLNDVTHLISTPSIVAAVDISLPNNEPLTTPDLAKTADLKTVSIIEEKEAGPGTVIDSQPSKPAETKEGISKPAKAKVGKPAGKMPQRRWIWVVAGAVLVIAIGLVLIAGKTSVITLNTKSTQVPTLGMGSTYTREQDGMDMVYVPAGISSMGSLDSFDEHPIHKVILDSYWIDKTEVTNAMYMKCVKADKCTPPYNVSSSTRNYYYGDNEYANYPVVFVNWNMAQMYCEWVDGRLPTEAEWEKAARGTDNRTYPWGKDINCTKASYYGCAEDTTEVGNYSSGISPYGAMNMAGNVWEWVADWYDSSYYRQVPTNNPTGPTLGDYRVLRGGSWNDFDNSLRVSNRSRTSPNTRLNSIGFRCVRTP